MDHSPRALARPLRVGDVVEVRSEAEILATLGPDGTIDGLPLMPEMLQHCGSRFTVSARADTTCFYGSLRRMESAVHLGDVRCDGSAHGGCQAGCLIYWKEEWLRPVEAAPGHRRPAATAPPVAREGCTREDVLRAVHPQGTTDDEQSWSCQATQVPGATTGIRRWDFRHLVPDVRAGNVKLRTLARWILPTLLFTYQWFSRDHLPRWLRLAGGADIPLIKGRLTKTPSVRLGLQPGEQVRVKSRQEIRATLDERARNRGLAFDVEMTAYCGKPMRVQRAVDRIIDEFTGRMLDLTGGCVVLEGGECQARYHGFCRRRTQLYWREIWLERQPGEHRGRG